MIEKTTKVIHTANGVLVWCTKGNQYKPAEEFYTWKSHSSGYSSSCKKCTLDYNRKMDREFRGKDNYETKEEYVDFILTKLGYDVESEIPIYEQFNRKHNFNK